MDTGSVRVWAGCQFKHKLLTRTSNSIPIECFWFEADGVAPTDLPDWAHLDAVTGIFTGSPPDEPGFEKDYILEVRDPQGRAAQMPVRIVVLPVPAAILAAQEAHSAPSQG